MVSRFLNDSFLLCHGLVMTVFNWFPDEKCRFFIVALKCRIHGYHDVSCKPEKITPVTKAPTVCKAFLRKK